MKTSYKLLLSAALAWAAPVAAQAPAAKDTVIEYRDAHVPPRAQNAAELVQAMDESYPSAQRQAGTGATVSASFLVGPDGVPRDVRVVSTTDSAFVQPTLAAVSRLRFTPGQVEGVPVSVRVELPLRWEVQEPPHPAEAAAEQLRARAAAAGPDSTGAYELNAVEVMPVLMNGGSIPRALQELYGRLLGEGPTAGRVNVRMRVGVNGFPTSIHVTRSSHHRFDEASIEVAGRMRFAPARVNGIPVSVWVEVPFEWGRF